MTDTPLRKNSGRTINAWCSYDIGNSAYNLCISSVLYPIYYEESTRLVYGSEMVSFLGITIKNTVIYEYAIAAGYLVVILLTMLLSGLADVGGYRKRFMQFFTFTGALACASLFFFNGNNLILGIGLPALAVIGYAGSLVYYNSFLPIIATPDRHNRISAKGFSFGYGGSMILLILSLLFIESHEVYGIETRLEAVRFTFLAVGIWWISWAMIAFYHLKEYKRKINMRSGILTVGFKELWKVFIKVRMQVVTSRFLIAFFFLSMGVQVVMIVAALFGSTELGITGSKLIVTIILIQVVGIIGSLLFGWVSTEIGNKPSLLIMLSIWVAICMIAYFITTEIQFYIVAAMVGLVMGGIQSQARSTYSKLIPQDSKNTASYFSFYDSTEKLAIVLGMFSFGILEHVTGSMRTSALLLSGFFIISFLVIVFTRFATKE